MCVPAFNRLLIYADLECTHDLIALIEFRPVGLTANALENCRQPIHWSYIGIDLVRQVGRQIRVCAPAINKLLIYTDLVELAPDLRLLNSDLSD